VETYILLAKKERKKERKT